MAFWAQDMFEAEPERAHKSGIAGILAYEAIPVDTPLARAIELFRLYPGARFLAVVDSESQPIGALHEQLVRDLLFSPFGHALLANPGCHWTLAEMVNACPVAEIDAPVDALIAVHDGDHAAEGVILTRGGLYVGLLPSQALLQLAAARERQEQARRFAEADAAIARADQLRSAFIRFEADAGEFGGALVAAAEEIRATATSFAARASRNGEQALIVAAASSQSADGIAEVSLSSLELARQGRLIESRVAEAEGAVELAVGHVARGAEKAGELARAADAIGSIVGMITDISTRVNMLAINATIEAVRAGPAGRSFAAVAGEVKALADQAGAAARDIEAQIDAVRVAVADSSAANNAIRSMVAMLEGVTAGIRESVSEQSSATTMIAATVEQCAQASAQISAHVGEMGGRAATAGDMALRLGGVAEGLTEQARTLSRRVDDFLNEIAVA